MKKLVAVVAMAILITQVSAIQSNAKSTWTMSKFTRALQKVDPFFYQDDSFWTYNRPIKGKYRVLGVVSSESWDCRIWVFMSRADSIAMANSEASVIFPGMRRTTASFTSHGRWVVVLVYDKDNGCTEAARRALR